MKAVVVRIAELGLKGLLGFLTGEIWQNDDKWDGEAVLKGAVGVAFAFGIW